MLLDLGEESEHGNSQVRGCGTSWIFNERDGKRHSSSEPYMLTIGADIEDV